MNTRLTIDFNNELKMILIDYGEETTIDDFRILFNQTLKYHAYAIDYRVEFKKMTK